MNADTATTVGGVALTSPVTLNLKRGLNLISIPYSSGYTSHSLIQSITGCKVVTPWDATGQRWGDSAFDAGGGLILPDEPFNIEVGRGYFVQVDADTPWTPSPPSPAPALWAQVGNHPHPNPLPSRARELASGVKITDIYESNISSSSVTISWVTDSITDGRVRYGTTPELGAEAVDERGMDNVHWVRITGLSPETTYYYEVVSGKSVDDNDGKLYTFTTSKIGQGVPYLVYGQILKDDQSTPAVGAVVYVAVEHGEVTSSFSAVVDKSGFWQVNLGNLKNPETNDVLSYNIGDAIHIFAQGGADGVGGRLQSPTTIETTLNGNSPQSIQPALILQSSEARLSSSSLMPSRNALLQNYPNPFNAETWIPYQLARESEVEIKIFNVAGQLVKTLKLEHRKAGYYLRKEQAAHWDGRNDLGESVASGVYFYTINAGGFKATRRLVILK